MAPAGGRGIPGRAEAWAELLRRQPPSWVPGHCRAVEGLADAFAALAEGRGLRPDRVLVRSGALLHDVGRSVTQDVRHASVGAGMLREEGWPEPLVLVVERHTGGGIDAHEAARLGLPVRDYTPRTLEERIVCHADNLYSGERRLRLSDLEAKYRAKGLDAAWEKILRLHHELGRELGADLERVEPSLVPEPG